MNDCFTSRRGIIKQFVLGTVSSYLAGSTWTQRVLADASAASGGYGTLHIKLSDFPALQMAGGSVRLNVGLDYPFSINRGTLNDFYAVDTNCAHQGCVVNAYDHTRQRMICPCHGSGYAIDGSLRNGPAQRGLVSYKTSFDGMNTVAVQVPGAPFAARRISVQSTNQGVTRVALEFTDAWFTDYQVQYRSSLNDEPVAVPFSLTPSGAANQTNFYRTSSPASLTRTIYVDATGDRGFYSIALVATSYD